MGHAILNALQNLILKHAKYLRRKLIILKLDSVGYHKRDLEWVSKYDRMSSLTPAEGVTVLNSRRLILLITNMNALSL